MCSDLKRAIEGRMLHCEDGLDVVRVGRNPRKRRKSSNVVWEVYQRSRRRRRWVNV